MRLFQDASASDASAIHAQLPVFEKSPTGPSSETLPKCQPVWVLLPPCGASAGNAANAELKAADFYQRRERRRDIYALFLDSAGGVGAGLRYYS